MVVCTVCGLWYPSAGQDRLDICGDCWRANFAGAQPSLDRRDPSARDILEAYVDTAHQMTPRQVEAMRRMAERWQEEDRHDL